MLLFAFQTKLFTKFVETKTKEMKSFTISIPDNKEDIFIEMMRNISFVKNIKEEISTNIPQAHKDIVRKRIQRMENQPESSLKWEDIEDKMQL
jgi:hypothetical protein